MTLNQSQFRNGAAIVASLALAVSASAVDINGGSSWNGWNLYGQSNDLGIYGGGSTANVYEIYTTQFTFNNNTVTGSPGGSTGFTTPLTPGAFQNGNRILGVGIRHISGSTSVTGGAPSFASTWTTTVTARRRASVGMTGRPAQRCSPRKAISTPSSSLRALCPRPSSSLVDRATS